MKFYLVRWDNGESGRRSIREEILCADCTHDVGPWCDAEAIEIHPTESCANCGVGVVPDWIDALQEMGP